METLISPLSLSFPAISHHVHLESLIHEQQQIQGRPPMNLSDSALNAKYDELGQLPSLVYMSFGIGMQNRKLRRKMSLTRSEPALCLFGKVGSNLGYMLVETLFIRIKYLSLRMPASVPEGVELDSIGMRKFLLPE